MIIVCYDISDDKKRSQFSKFLEQYGERIQYSVFKIKNSQRILNLIITEINIKFGKMFDDSDSILIFQLCEGCKKKVIRFGSAKHEEDDVIYFV